MAAGRLTYEDRRRIAAGLAQDLSYAEIARRLDRPTSTVTREVMRGGGPRAYRAEKAHRIAKARVPNSGSRPIPAPDSDGRDPEALREAETRLATLLVQTGLPTMPAGVLACLYTTDSGAVTAAELVSRLRVSAASVSTAVRYLEEQQLVSREKGQGRKERYRIDEDAWYRAMIASANTNNRLADASHEAADLLGSGTPAAERLDGMARFLRQVGEDLIRSAEHWRPQSALPGEHGERLD
jgi:DNA-binding transcriptional regulator GbsR (MarR family)